MSLFPATYQQTDSNLPQDQSLPDKTVDTRPVPVSAAAEEGQVIDDGDIYEMAGLLDDPGNGFQIIATIFGDENIWGARDVGLSLGAVKGELQRCVLVEEGEQALGPEGGNEVFILEPPVETEHPVEVQSQTAAVVHQHTQLLPLENKHTAAGSLDTTSVTSPSAWRTLTST